MIDISADSRYSVGVPSLDAQHQTLFNMVHELGQALMRLEGVAAAQDILPELVRYTEVHFAHEEELMRQAGYPHLAQHQVKHLRMRNRVLEMATCVERAELDLALELNTYLNRWLQKHICQTDRHYSIWLVQAGLA